MKTALGFVWLAVGAAALVAAVIWWRAEPDGAGDGGARPPYVLPVELAEVRRDTVRPHLALTGSVRTARWARAAFESPGILAALLVEEAQEVAGGELLARLDDRDARLDLERAEADLAVARRRLELLEAGARAEVVKRLAAELEAARASEDLAEQEVQRREVLAEERDVSRAEMDRVKAALREARAFTAAAVERHAEALAGTRAEDLAVATAQLRVAEAAVDRARRELAKTELRAPWAGTVIRRLGSEGDYLQTGQPLLELADLENLEVHLDVPSSSALQVRPGAPLTLRTEAAPGFELRTELDAAVPTADLASRNFRAVARVKAGEQSRDVLRPGMFVRGDLELAPREGELVVPSDAVRLTERGFLVSVAEPTAEGLVARQVFVELLGEEAGLTAVRPIDGALEAGDRVVVTGVDLTYEGVALLPREQGAGAPVGAAAP